MDPSPEPSLPPPADSPPGTKLENQKDVYTDIVRFDSSVWDAALLIGMKAPDGHMSYCQAIEIFVVLFLNVCVQLIFCYAIYGMVGEQYDDFSDELVRGAVQNRFNRGHAWHNIHWVTGETRASRVCNTQIYSSAATVAENVQTYLGDGPGFEGGFGYVEGHFICWLAMFIWSASIMAELRQSVKVLWAIYETPRAKTLSEDYTLHVGKAAAQDLLVIAHLSRLHKTSLVASIVGPRIFIALTLHVFGLMFLMESTAQEDIILNTCALEIVKSVDELLFCAILTTSVRTLTESTVFEIQREKRRPGWQQDLFWIPCMIFILASVLISNAASLQGHVERVGVMEEALCNQDLDFAYVYHPISNMPIFTDIRELSAGSNYTCRPVPDLPGGSSEVLQAILVEMDHSTYSQADSMSTINCFYKARNRLFEYRAGFHGYTSEIARLVQGTHPDCCNDMPYAMNGTIARTCPNLPVREFKCLTEHGNPLCLCEDQDVQLEVLQESCAHVAAVQSFLGRGGCSTLRPLCHITDATIAGFDGLTDDWMRIIQKVCPKTCGFCKDKCPQHPCSESKFRRLDAVNAPQPLWATPAETPIEGDCRRLEQRLQRLEEEKADLVQRVDKLTTLVLQRH